MGNQIKAKCNPSVASAPSVVSFVFAVKGVPKKSLITATLAIVLACCRCAFPLDPSLDVKQYAHTAWKVREGFARGEIHSIAQTPDGYLWLGTESGLLRFDGVNAVPWSPPDGERLPSNYITNLIAARDGTLWIATIKGLASWKDGKLTQHPEVAGALVGWLLEDRKQTVWVGTWETSKARLCAIRKEKIECYGSGTFGNFLRPLGEDHEGNLWAAGSTAVWRWAPGRPARYPFPRGVTSVASLIEDDAGRLLLATTDGLKQVVAGKIESYPLPGITGKLRPTRFLRTSDGSLWIGTEQGLLHLHQGRVDGFRAADGLSSDSVNDIFQDREGNVWVATQDGLDRFHEYAVPTISRNQGLSNSASWAVQATPDGSIWIATADGLDHWAIGHVAVYRSRNTFSQRTRGDETQLNVNGAVIEITDSGLVGGPRSLGLDDLERLWASTSDGVFYLQSGRFVRIPDVPGGNIFSIAGDGHGNVWILHGTAIFYWSPTRPIQHTPLTQFAQKTARVMLPDREPGGLWLGFFEGGVAYLKDGKAVRSYGPADGLGDGRINHLRWGSLNGVWAATESGLSRIKNGHIETLNSRNGLPCDEVHWSMEDDDHAVWVYMPCGLARIESSEWHAWTDNPQQIVKTTIFDTSDGVRSVGLYGSIGPHVTKSPDGRIWFVPRDGVSVIDPHRLAFNKLPPPVHVERVVADGKTYDAASQLRLPSLARDLQIDYTALSLVAPERVLFRYKLEGFDRDWQQAGNRRQAFYTNLSPGNYTFRMMACNNSGVWNEAGATVDFSITPAYYETTWFRSLCVAVFVGLLWSVYELRRWQLHQQFNMRMEARLNERERIARELHDTLLQGFHGLMFRFQAARNILPRRPEEGLQALDGAISRAEQVLAEGRDAIQGLRSASGAQADLAQSLAAIGQELAARNGDQDSPHFRVIVEGERRKLFPAFQSEVYRMGCELLQNAFQHAWAREIEAEIRYDHALFHLLVRDDGKGIDVNILEQGGRPGHWGLPGIRERAQQIGAHVDFWSQAGAGTEIELTVPGNIAYEKK